MCEQVQLYAEYSLYLRLSRVILLWSTVDVSHLRSQSIPYKIPTQSIFRNSHRPCLAREITCSFYQQQRDIQDRLRVSTYNSSHGQSILFESCVWLRGGCNRGTGRIFQASTPLIIILLYSRWQPAQVLEARIRFINTITIIITITITTTTSGSDGFPMDPR